MVCKAGRMLCIPTYKAFSPNASPWSVAKWNSSAPPPLPLTLSDTSLAVPLTFIGSLPPTLIDRIPLETFEGIIDQMDHPSLPVAALVCKAWHHRATTNLYSTVEIISRTNYHLLVERFRTSSHVQQMLARTRTIIVKGFSYPVTRATFLDSLPLVFATALPALRTFAIYGALRPAMHPTFYRALRQFGHLLSLRLSDVRLSNVTELQRVVYAFPNLQALHLRGVTLVHTDSACCRYQLPTHTPLEYKLKQLELFLDEREGERPYLTCITNWLVGSTICASLTDLAAGLNGLEVIGARGQQGRACEQITLLLETCGPSLLSFHGRLAAMVEPPAGYHLVHNTALRRLTLEVDLFNVGHWEEKWLRAASRLYATLSTVRSQQLECITIKLTYDDWGSDWTLVGPEAPILTQEMLTSQWRSLHDVMDRLYSDKLRDVTVETLILHYGGLWSEEEANAVDQRIIPIYQQLFAPWNHRGIVKMTNIDHAQG
ncbi:hypothetical protein EVJ58_g7945 [Rhodofomes roseus]|uniref:F-box domain-containing protein n=1 Tax=Rhodofomes roseus TaxID=34475 RepID=A0A4Y9Y0B0_9APHY|nr:hypothetical protein EVJ58_g7945 [Rhodofomes roseus]